MTFVELTEDKKNVKEIVELKIFQMQNILFQYVHIFSYRFL